MKRTDFLKDIKIEKITPNWDKAIKELTECLKITHPNGRWKPNQCNKNKDNLL